MPKGPRGENMGFRDREKRRLGALKRKLFSQEACRDGLYQGKRRQFCLHEDCNAENLNAEIREAALAYFEDRDIWWHDKTSNGPSNHLCCSQTCCVNFWMPFVQAPDALAEVLRGLGYDVDRMMPLSSDCPLGDGSLPYVAFEWIGEKNYLKELRGREVASDESRTRGRNFTSLDFCVRFLRSDGLVQLVAGEWKYTENYNVKLPQRYSDSGTDRLDQIYRPHLERRGCQIRRKVPFEDLFFDPFDQLMRQQLLCSAMERHREMHAAVVSLLHVAPRSNQELMQRVPSNALAEKGSNIHDVWAALVHADRFGDRFKGVALEDLLPLVAASVPDPQTRDYLRLRYGDMR